MNLRPRIFRVGGKCGSRRARAAAIVEMAVVLPLLLTILFGIIEFGWVFMIRLSLQHAAREGCRLASLRTTEEPYTEVTARINGLLAPTGMTTHSISMTHPTLATPVETVTIRVPYQDVSLVGGFFWTDNFDLTGSCSMRKEGMGG